MATRDDEVRGAALKRQHARANARERNARNWESAVEDEDRIGEDGERARPRVQQRRALSPPPWRYRFRVG